MQKIALITGATSGIGEATARYFAKHGIGLVICGRNKERLEKLAGDLNKVPVHSLCFDVRNQLEVDTAIHLLPPDFKTIDILVNNAGNAHGMDLFQEALMSDWENMIDTNLKGLLYVTRAVLPGMIERKQGHIVNIASIAGKENYLKGNVYCATKHAVQSISDSMRLDLIASGIKVSSISPGLVETEFSNTRFKGDTARAKKVYEGIHPLSAKDIAEIILFAVTRPAHVNISDLTVLACAQASASVVHRTQSSN